MPNVFGPSSDTQVNARIFSKVALRGKNCDQIAVDPLSFMHPLFPLFHNAVPYNLICTGFT